MKFEQVNPPATLRALEAEKGPWVDERRQEVVAATGVELVALNKKWFTEPTGMRETLGMLWLINTRFTVLRIAPAWRGIPAYIDVKPMPSANPGRSGPKLIGDTARRTLIRRWVDLEWLRSLIWPAHRTEHQKWQHAFAADLDKAEATWARINAVVSTGGGKASAEPPRKVHFSLDVPKLMRLGLTGLIDRDSGELLMHARQRVARTVKPRLEALMTRPTYPLTQQGVDRRLVFAEALELAPGSPSDAATIFGWITGESITRQSMHTMREKIAEQCKLTTRAWVAPKRLREGV